MGTRVLINETWYYAYDRALLRLFGAAYQNCLKSNLGLGDLLQAPRHPACGSLVQSPERATPRGTGAGENGAVMIRVLLAALLMVVFSATSQAGGLDHLKAAKAAVESGNADEAIHLFTQALAA